MFLAAFTFSAHAASASESIKTIEEDGHTLLMIVSSEVAGSTGAAQEVNKALEASGFRGNPLLDGSVLNADGIFSRFSMSQATLTVGFTIDVDSSYSIVSQSGTTEVSLKGSIASRLFKYMSKAGFARHAFTIGQSVAGEFVNCTENNRITHQADCSIRLLSR
jgi:hypothetical protein